MHQEMIDEEKKKMLGELLKQMYSKMADSGEDMPLAGKETPAEEAMEEGGDSILDMIKDAEDEEIGGQEEGESDSEEDGGLAEEKLNFFKSRPANPDKAKAVAVMMKMKTNPKAKMLAKK